MCQMSLLRSWGKFSNRCYKHYAPTELRTESLVFRISQQHWMSALPEVIVFLIAKTSGKDATRRNITSSGRLC